LNGPALGGGCGIVFSCDIRLLKRDSFIAFPEVKRGLAPAIISTIIVPQLGPFVAGHYFLTGERLSAEQLYKHGAITAIVDDDHSMECERERWLKELLSGSSEAMTNIKFLLRQIQSSGTGPRKLFVNSIFENMLLSEEALYGIACFRDGRTPDWNHYFRQKRQLNLRINNDSGDNSIDRQNGNDIGSKAKL